jgi:alanine dehydrogenase
MGGADGVPPARVLIIGGGNAGRSAADVAIGMGADVCVLDASDACVAALRTSFGRRCRVETFSTVAMLDELDGCDLLIGAALIAGEHAPQLLGKDQLARMHGGVFVDIAIDQGGIATTCRPTSYAEPVYVEAGVMHCCLPNMPACVPFSATRALTHATLPYVQMLADLGIRKAMDDAALTLGVNTWDGHITHVGVAHALNLVCTPLADILSQEV